MAYLKLRQGAEAAREAAKYRPPRRSNARYCGLLRTYHMRVR
jgi:hypothetical protein